MQRIVLPPEQEYVFVILAVRFGVYEAELIQGQVKISSFLLDSQGGVDVGDDDKVVEDVEFDWGVEGVRCHFDLVLAVVADALAEQPVQLHLFLLRLQPPHQLVVGQVDLLEFGEGAAEGLPILMAAGQLTQVVLEQQHVFEHPVLGLGEQVDDGSVTLALVQLAHVFLECGLDVGHLRGVRIVESSEELRALQTIAEVGSVQFVEGGEVQ